MHYSPLLKGIFSISLNYISQFIGYHDAYRWKEKGPAENQLSPLIFLARLG